MDMDHTHAVREMMTERYLLNELSPELREDFEEHFFECPECARDLKAGAAIIEHTQTILSASGAKDSLPVAAKAQERSRGGWFAWLVPAFAAPALALLLLVIGYQNLVQYPKLKESVAALNAPQILPSASLTIGRDAGMPQVDVAKGGSFLLFLDVPADAHYGSYRVELRGPDGPSQWTLSIPGEAAKETLSIRVPAGAGKSGVQTVVLYGLNAGEKKDTELRQYRFQLNYR